MSLLRDRNRRPEAPSPRRRLEALSRAYRSRSALSLDALVAGLDPSECRNRGRCAPTERIVDDAVGVYLKAFDALRRGSATERATVRGCTLDLLVLLSEQVLDLADRHEQQAREKAANAEATARAMAQLRTQYARALTTREQARRLLAGMARDDASYQAEVRRAATAADAGGSVGAAMVALAALGRAVLADPDPAVSVRARLLGLDESYAASLEALGLDVQQREAELKGLTASDPAEDPGLSTEAGVTLHLMMIVVEAFESAHEVEASIPLLRPVHTHRLVRRLSKLPPPVGVVATAVRGR